MAGKENLPLSRSGSPSPPRSSRSLPPLTGFARIFYNASRSGRVNIAPWEPPPFRKEFFFFCGTLMDITTLTNVLHLKERPRLQPATVVGYHCKLWGAYPVLLDGPYGAEVTRVAYEVESAEHVKLLQDYGTERYREASCEIQLMDGSMVVGSTFVWDLNDEELCEGVFDLKDFQMNQLEVDLMAVHQPREC